MRHQVRPCQEQGGRPGAEQAPREVADPLADGAAGSAGLWWLWDLVELRLSPDGPGAAG